MPDHHGAPYSLTEDFVTVYRLHPLLPDDYCFYITQTGEQIAEKAVPRYPGRRRRRRHAAVRPAQHALFVRHRPSRRDRVAQFPAFAAAASSATTESIDLSVVDIVRTRRRGVPRYNDFRAGLHKPRDHALGRAARRSRRRAHCSSEIYGDIDKVDTVVGLLAEPAPAGFGF